MKEFVEKILSELEKHIFSAELYNYEWKGQAVHNLLCLGDVKNVAEQLAEEYNNGWIPCSERLPEVEADVLVSLRSLDVYTGFRANTEGCFYVEGEGYVEFENVLAWQPLLEPYKELTT